MRTDYLKISWDSIQTAAYYTVYKSSTSDANAASIVNRVQTVASAVNYTFYDSQTEPSANYWYWVSATNASNEESTKSSPVTHASPPKPGKVTNPVASFENNEITLKWDALNGVNRYKIFKTSNGDNPVDASLIAETGGTTFVDTSVTRRQYV